MCHVKNNFKSDVPQRKANSYLSEKRIIFWIISSQEFGANQASKQTRFTWTQFQL